MALLSLDNVRFLVSPVRLIDENLTMLWPSESDDLRSFQPHGILSTVVNYLMGKKPIAPLFVYENRLHMPRFFPVAKVDLFDRSSDLLDALGQADYDALRSTAFLNRSDVEHVPFGGLSAASAEVMLSGYSPDSIVLNVRSASDFILIASNSYSPYWRASIDGVQTSIFPVNHTFQGLLVEKGNHTIRLHYRPPYKLPFFERCIRFNAAQLMEPAPD